MYSTRETVVWITRHGVSSFNVDGRCQGCCDVPELTRDGRGAARKIGERLRSAGIEVVLSSPLQRATDTAVEIIDQFYQKGVSFELDSRLREIELPHWEGLRFAEIQHRFPEQFRLWRLNPSRFNMPSSTPEFPVKDLYERVKRFWQDTLKTHAGKTILLVTHGGTARSLITTALGLGPEHFHNVQQSNCGISRLRFLASGQEALLDLLNDTSHLDARLPKLKEGKTGLRLLLVPAMESSTTDLRQVASVLGPMPLHAVFAVGCPGKCAAARIFGRHGIEMIPEGTLTGWIHQRAKELDGRPLLHAAVMASPDCLRRLIQQQFVLSASEAEQLVFTGSGVSVVHSPGDERPPVLQAMNMFEPQLGSTGVSL